MEKTFKACGRKQMLLPPSSWLNWLPEEHPVYYVTDVVEELDLSEPYVSYKGDGRGRPPHDPAMLTALLLHAYCTGVPSSRRIGKRTREDFAFRMIAANRHVGHDSICDFRKRHLKSLAGFFVQVLRLCQEAGLVDLGHVALDGTKVRADTSRHKALSYGRMELWSSIVISTHSWVNM